MPNVVVKPHVDTFMKSDDSSDALDAIGGLPESDFAGLSSTFATDSEIASLSASYLLRTEFSGLSTTFSQGSLSISAFAGLSSTLLPKTEFRGLSSTLLPISTFAGLSSTLSNTISSVAGRGGRVILSAIDISDSSIVGRSIVTSASADNVRDAIVAVKKPVGPYTNALAASIAGATYNEPYFTTDYNIKILRDSVSSVAFIGDSVTSQGTTGYLFQAANSYAVWAKSFNQAKWDFTQNTIDGNQTFSIAGLQSWQLASTMLSSLSTTNAKIVFIAWGINDVQNGSGLGSLAAYLSASRFTWDILRQVGMYPIQATIIPPLTCTNTLALRWLQYNDAIKTEAAMYNVPICDWAYTLALSSDAVSGNNVYYTDVLHPNTFGASELGRVVARTLVKYFDFTLNNYITLSALTQNYVLSGTTPSSVPTGWSIFSGGGTSSIGTTMLSSTSKGNWYTVPLIKGDSTASFTFGYSTSNTTTVSSKNLEGFMDFEVLSGKVACSLSLYQYPGNTQIASDGFNYSLSSVYVPSDGMICFRTHPYVPPSTATGIAPSISILPQENAIVRFRNVGVRQI